MTSRTKSILSGPLAAVLLMAMGCRTPLPPGTERGPSGTIAYIVKIEATEPGAQIEVNGEAVGRSPIDIKIFGDRDGTFHDFGSYVYVIRALPVASNQFAQTRVFQTGRGFTPQDRIPNRIYFDMTQNTPPPPVYPEGPTHYYGPGPYYYGPPPYYYGPSFRFHLSPGFFHHRHRHHRH
jgi:hypothetical protein